MGGMKLAALLLAAVLTTACIHPMPNPGQVVLSCAMDAAKDPHIKEQILDALTQGNFESILLGLLNPALGITEATVLCIIHSFIGTLGADPSRAAQYQHARAYLLARGVQL